MEEKETERRGDNKEGKGNRARIRGAIENNKVEKGREGNERVGRVIETVKRGQKR